MIWFWCGSAIFVLMFSTICVVADQGWRTGLQFLANGLWLLADILQAIAGLIAFFS